MIKNKLAVCGNCKSIADSLRNYQYETFIIGESTMLPAPVANHADMLCAVAADGTVLTYDRALQNTLISRQIRCFYPESILGMQYPYDVALNCLHIGKLFVANTRYCDNDILARAGAAGCKILHVNQGYTRCSTAVISDNAAITADASIAEALREEGIDVLQIQSGYISLPGYSYGFIGGSCARLPDSNVVLFCGDPMTHPDGGRIASFIRSHGCDFRASHNGQLFDFGGVVFIENNANNRI